MRDDATTYRYGPSARGSGVLRPREMTAASEERLSLGVIRSRRRGDGRVTSEAGRDSLPFAPSALRELTRLTEKFGPDIKRLLVP